MIVRSKRDLEGLEEIGRIVALVRDQLIEMVVPGISLLTLDHKAKDLFEQEGAVSAPIRDYDFPGQVCISLNEVAAHGIPTERLIQNGDVVNVDVSALKDGYYADTGATIIAGESQSPKHDQLIIVSQRALEAGIEAAVAGNRVYHIGEAIYKVASDHGFTVIRNLMGHGIGKSLHEAPNAISNYRDDMESQKIKVGHVLAIETFISLDDEWVDEGDDGWALMGSPQNRTVQFEHTVVVEKTGPRIITPKIS